MTTVYGQSALEVPQPDGDVVGYLWRAVPALPEEWRAWIVVSPKGAEHRVTEFADLTCRCSCPAWRYNRYAAGRWLDVNGKPACKHCWAVHRDVILPQAEAAHAG